MNHDSQLELAESLRQELAEKAAKLRPFPAFWGMTTIQAIELEPEDALPADRGCVVLTPEGTICGLDLVGIMGAEGPIGEDFVEDLRELALPPGEYVIYARAGLKALEDALMMQ